MPKVEITEWGELAIIEMLLSEYRLNHGRYALHMDACESLLKRVRPALMVATEKLDV